MEKDTSTTGVIISMWRKTAMASYLVVYSAFLAFWLLGAPSTSALIPSTLNFQGRLTDSTGALMPDGLYNMQFKIYTVPTGGSASWSEIREVSGSDYRVQVTNGLFSTQLGQRTALPASLFANTDLYFEITMANPATATCSTAACQTWESPMVSRQKLATSAYAYNSDTLDGLDSTAFAQLAANNTWTGTNTIQNTSTSAFSVQNAGGVALLGVNTTAGTTTISGNSNSQSLIVKASSTLASNNAIIQLQDSTGSVLANINADSSGNDFFGYASGDSRTTGYLNTGIGNQALGGVADGSENTGLGAGAGGLIQ